MQKRVSSLVICLALMVSMSSHAAAAESNSKQVNIVVNSTQLAAETTATKVVNNSVYVSYWPVVAALYPDATVAWENGKSVVRANGLTMYITPGASYIGANGRYLYVEDTVLVEGQSILLPARVLAKALGASVAWANNTVTFLAGSGPIASGSSYYNSDSVYWLSRIINAESGNQPLSGKIAVGNVVLNRVASALFPNTVKGVVFQKNQFTPVSNGSIYKTPNEQSVIAAKLWLDGANTVGNSLYFVNPRVSPNSWASRNRPYVATIGAHAFFA